MPLPNSSRRLLRNLALFSLTTVAIVYGASQMSLPSRATDVATAQIPDPTLNPSTATGQQTAVLAGGCFWGMEAVFEHVKGVSDVVSGFSGGDARSAHYNMVSFGGTDHAEAVQITYDPSQISYGELLKIYFSVAHNPTELNRQGPDSGTQYRSAIFFVNDEQRQVAQSYIEQLNKSQVFPAPIVTQLNPLDKFYPAEDYHQNFIDRNPDYPYVVIHDLPKLEQLRQKFPSLYK
ncbi:MAG: peptide-methionine (S)-S-oxide reductase MsrA [Drouetiella hepatica Uher 2000/2452]|jgi:peptide-methionine (S)-S-oxide reductase|uniref:Peptide methionine sulfoxide reductase MsrA n=1 Tax=Drouetiella hepatica Uher 2000/2452 TaxID=904376 RepID=A0A951Q6T1_9CYAN|nr:peptide-methionine (S)-S-oxide reductase MsrA [Drouetiella hepatica Uher 2000/2452]